MPDRDERLRWAARVNGALVAVLGIVVMVGWCLGLDRLTRVVPTMVSMKFNTALGLFASGVALMLSSKRAALAVRGIGLGVLLLGSLTTLEHLLGLDLHIDELLFDAHGDGRMASVTAISFMALGLSFATLDRPRFTRWLTPLALVPVLAGYVGIVGYLFSVTALVGARGYASVALHTAFALPLLGLGVMLARPERSLVATLVEDSSAAATLRASLPFAIVMPLAVGGLRLELQRRGQFGTEFGLALMVTFCTVLFAGTLVWSARRQSRSETRRKEAVEDLRFLGELSEQLRAASSSERVLSVLAAHVNTYFGGAGALFYEIDPDAGAALVVANSAPGTPVGTVLQLNAFSPETQRALRHGELVRVNDTSTDARTASRYATAYAPQGLRSFLAFPLQREGRWVGVLAVTSQTPRVWTARELELVTQSSERAWLWFEHLRALELLRRDEASQLRAALAEREVLLQEVHHRVKNNLQVISSLINLQVRQVSDTAASSALKDCATRVETIAEVHAQLYQSSDYAGVPFSDYAARLAQNVFRAQGVSPEAVSLELQIAPMTLTVEQAIPCGLILNELMTNALKHAFPEARRGTLRVALQAEGGSAQLSVSDDGVGMREHPVSSESGSLGMELVTTLTEQLEGHLELIRAPGTAVRITFPVTT